MWRRVGIVWTDILEDFSTLKMEAIRSSETSVYTRSTRRHIPEDGILDTHGSKNLKTYNSNFCFTLRFVLFSFLSMVY
jgi:hypothetical protein